MQRGWLWAGMMTAPVGGHMPAQRLVAERRWRLGVHSRGHPSAVVAELLRALQGLRVAWKKVGPYNYKCRAATPAAAGAPRRLCAWLGTSYSVAFI